ncbi:hypothetical protein [Pseudomonas sp. S5D5]|uniref:hypothetical protein n=1 Tax=Pseudomonas sp. S5D5 TaxID=2083056 RepID=UPI0013005F17|nr:hypothetical protein [Pseudomonas sp. S5D5]QTV16132.1 hypothetical protein J9321_23775 [Pseudomonas fluorescens]
MTSRQWVIANNQRRRLNQCLLLELHGLPSLHLHGFEDAGYMINQITIYKPLSVQALNRDAPGIRISHLGEQRLRLCRFAPFAQIIIDVCEKVTGVENAQNGAPLRLSWMSSILKAALFIAKPRIPHQPKRANPLPVTRGPSWLF